MVRNAGKTRSNDSGKLIPSRRGHESHAGSDLDNHHRGSDTDHDARAAFRVRKIRDEIVPLTKTRVIRAMHLDLG